MTYARKRLREIGIRKTFGGTKRQVVVQYMLENSIQSFLALILGMDLASKLMHERGDFEIFRNEVEKIDEIVEAAGAMHNISFNQSSKRIDIDGEKQTVQFLQVGDNYINTHRTPVGPEVYLATYLVIFLTALITSGRKIVKSAHINPARSLRYE